MKSLISFSVLCLFFIAPISAESLEATTSLTQEPSAYRNVQGFGISLDLINLDDNVADALGMDSSGYGLSVDYSGDISEYFNFAAGLSFVSFDDKAGFSQRVENVYGDESTESSSITGVGFNADIGPQLRLSNDTVRMGINAGYRNISVDREISNCSDCYSQDLDLKGSTYFKPFISIQVSDSIAIGASYYSYQADESFDNSIQFKLTWLQ